MKAMLIALHQGDAASALTLETGLNGVCQLQQQQGTDVTTTGQSMSRRRLNTVVVSERQKTNSSYTNSQINKSTEFIMDSVFTLILVWWALTELCWNAPKKHTMHFPLQKVMSIVQMF
jgi:hypothetical protein